MDFNPESKRGVIRLQSVHINTVWTLFHLKICYWSHTSYFWLCTLIKSLLIFYTCVAFNLLILRESDMGQWMLSMWICLYKWINRPYIRKHQLSVTFEGNLNSLVCLLSCSEKYCTNGVKRGICYQCNRYGRLSVLWSYKGILFSTLQFEHQKALFMMHINTLENKENLHLLKVHVKSVVNSLLERSISFAHKCRLSHWSILMPSLKLKYVTKEINKHSSKSEHQNLFV